MGRTLNRAEKAQVLGLDTPNGSARQYPLGSMEEAQDGSWLWTLTCTDAGTEHRLIIRAMQWTSFKPWFDDGNQDLVLPRAHVNIANGNAITTARWLHVAEEAVRVHADIRAGSRHPGIFQVSLSSRPVSRLVRGLSNALQWATVTQAAHRLGVSVETVRRRVREGKLNARRVTTPTGYSYLIDMSNEPVQRHLDDAPTTSRSAPVEPLPLPVVASVAPVPVAPVAQASSSDATQVAMLLRLYERVTPQVRAETLERLLDAALR
jgi:excisionase family DNA binding protein